MNILSAVYADSVGSGVLCVTSDSGNVFVALNEPSAARDEYLAWQGMTDDFVPVEVDAIGLAEEYIASHFSTARLLQMKVWWDTFPHESLPKLGAILQWTSAITSSAIQGGTEFPNPPHTFEEIAQEALNR